MNESRPPNESENESEEPARDPQRQPADGGANTGDERTDTPPDTASDTSAGSLSPPGGRSKGSRAGKRGSAPKGPAEKGSAADGESGDGKSGKEGPEEQSPGEEKPGSEDSGDKGAKTDQSGGAEPGAASPGDRNGAAAAGSAAPPPRRGRRLALGVAVIALLIALGLGAFAAYLDQRVERLEERLAAVGSERESAIEAALGAAVAEVDTRSDVAAVERRLERQLEREREAAEQARERLVERVERHMMDMDVALDDVRELVVGHHTRWRLAEVRFLVSMAVRRLQLAEDRDGAEAALEAADEALHRLGDARLLPLRQALADDIARVRAIETADVEGIALRLMQLNGVVEVLPLQQEVETRAPPPVDPDAPLWEQMIERLRGLVVVRHRDAVEPVRGLPLADAELAPREAVRLTLRRARMAALNGDGEGYQRAMGQAAELLDEHFDTQAQAVEDFHSRLTRLAERPVTTSIPDLSPTLEKVARLTAQLEAERERPQGGSGEALE